LGGITPAPIDRFGRVQKEIAKTALGAEKKISLESVKNLTYCVNNLKKRGFEIIALEQGPSSVPIAKLKPKFPLALIIGNEVGGVSRKLLDKSNKIIEILMLGKKESLNVSVAFGISIFEILR